MLSQVGRHLITETNSLPGSSISDLPLAVTGAYSCSEHTANLSMSETVLGNNFNFFLVFTIAKINNYIGYLQFTPYISNLLKLRLVLTIITFIPHLSSSLTDK